MNITQAYPGYEKCFRIACMFPRPKNLDLDLKFEVEYPGDAVWDSMSLDDRYRHLVKDAPADKHPLSHFYWESEGGFREICSPLDTDFSSAELLGFNPLLAYEWEFDGLTFEEWKEDRE